MVVSDEELISNWKTKRDLKSYQTLKKRHTPMVFQYVHRYTATSIPRPALEAEAWGLFDDAVNTFKPGAGAKFSTHLNYQLRKLDRYAKKHQNVARIPEAIAGKIGDYDRGNLELTTKLSRAPTNKELSKHLKMPVSQIKQIQVSRRGDMFEGMTQQDVTLELNADATKWVLQDIREELNPQEQQVFDHLTGFNGKKKYTNKKLLAQKLGMSPGRLSQITSDISRKIQPHLNKRLRG